MKPERIEKSTQEVISGVASHTGVDRQSVIDVIYAFLHFVKYTALSSERSLSMRNLGVFYLSQERGRVFGSGVGVRKYVGDRIKLAFRSPTLEVQTWKNMQSIQRFVLSAQPADVQLSSMDQSVCARIVALVLTSPELFKDKSQLKTLAREWAYAAGVGPIRTNVEPATDPYGNPYIALPYRLAGQKLYAVAFEQGIPVLEEQDKCAFFATDHCVVRGKSWTYGDTVEERALALFSAYIATRYPLPH